MYFMSRAVCGACVPGSLTPLPHASLTRSPRRLQATTRPRPSPPPGTRKTTTTSTRTRTAAATTTTTCTWPSGRQPVRSGAEPQRRYSYLVRPGNTPPCRVPVAKTECLLLECCACACAVVERIFNTAKMSASTRSRVSTSARDFLVTQETKLRLSTLR